MKPRLSYAFACIELEAQTAVQRHGWIEAR